MSAAGQKQTFQRISGSRHWSVQSVC